MINKIYLKKNKLSSGNINNNTNKNTNKNDSIPKYNPDVNIKYNKMMNNRQDNININSISNTNDDLFKNKYSENDVDKRIIDKNFIDLINERDNENKILKEKYKNPDNKNISLEEDNIENINSFIELKNENKEYYITIDKENELSKIKKNNIYSELKNMGIF